jgi:hypothetical protein
MDQEIRKDNRIMRNFELIRLTDISAVSGTGTVAEGVEFNDGTVAMRWICDNRSTAIYNDIGSLKAIHGHNGATEVSWL